MWAKSRSMLPVGVMPCICCCPFIISWCIRAEADEPLPYWELDWLLIEPDVEPVPDADEPDWPVPY